MWWSNNFYYDLDWSLVYYCVSQPENLLLDANGVLKVSDFGLSALPQQVRVSDIPHVSSISFVVN